AGVERPGDRLPSRGLKSSEERRSVCRNVHGKAAAGNGDDYSGRADLVRYCPLARPDRREADERRYGSSNVDDAQKLSQSAFARGGAGMRWTVLTSHGPLSGNVKLTRPSRSVRAESFSDEFLALSAITSAPGLAAPRYFSANGSASPRGVVYGLRSAI